MRSRAAAVLGRLTPAHRTLHPNHRTPRPANTAPASTCGHGAFPDPIWPTQLLSPITAALSKLACSLTAAVLASPTETLAAWLPRGGRRRKAVWLWGPDTTKRVRSVVTGVVTGSGRSPASGTYQRWQQKWQRGRAGKSRLGEEEAGKSCLVAFPDCKSWLNWTGELGESRTEAEAVRLCLGCRKGLEREECGGKV